MGSSSAVGCLADSLSVIYRGHEFEPQPGHIAKVLLVLVTTKE